jgi:hypothetical protein
MQTKKRAKPVKFGKTLPPKTEKKETQPAAPKEVSEETVHLKKITPAESQEKKETKEIEVDVSHTHIKEEISEDLETPVVDEHKGQNTVPTEEVVEDESNESEKNDERSEGYRENTEEEHSEPEEQGEEEVTKNEKDEQKEDEEPKEDFKDETQQESDEIAVETKDDGPAYVEPFSKAELAADSSSSWKQLILYFFLIAFVAFLLGLAFIGGVYYAGKSIKLPVFHLPSFGIHPTPTKMPIPTATDTPAPTPDLSAYSIQVLNGSGITGEAAKLKAELTSAGFKVDSTGNADNSDYTKTQISASKSVNQTYVTKLEETLKQWYTVEVVQPSSSQTSDVVVTIGSSTK